MLIEEHDRLEDLYRSADNHRQVEARRQRIVTLAAALITARGDGSVAAAITAMHDAANILHPKPTDQAYKTWQKQHGLEPTTPEQDLALAREHGENVARMMESMRGW
jgi:hypothetical protein